MLANWSRCNPVDIIGDAPAERYVQALAALNADPGAGAVLFMHAPTAIVPSADIARALVPLASQSPPRVLGCWMGGESVEEARQIFQAAGIAGYEPPEEAVRAFSMVTTYRRNQAQLIESGTCPARLTLIRALSAGWCSRCWTAGVCSPAQADSTGGLRNGGRHAECRCDPAEAARTAGSIGFPVALKILSKDISHKSDIGGVVLDLSSADDVERSAAAMLARVRRLRPAARIEGFAVQAMIRRAHAQELMSVRASTVCWSVILFGQGGTAVEVLADRAVALPPLNLPLARALVARTRVAKLLGGFRDTPPADENAICSVLIAVSQLLADVPQIAELDINPLIVNHEGVIALDARIRLSAAAPAGALNFAIRPYPADLIESLHWKGRTLTLRQIRPEDEEQHLEFLHLDPEDVRQRCFTASAPSSQRTGA
jgi:acetyltransferase